MAVELATAYVSIVPSTAGLGASLTKDLTTGEAAAATTAAGKTAGTNYATKFIMAAGAAYASGKILSVFYDAASEAEQAIGGVSAVFKDNAGVVNDWAASAAMDLGLTETAYQTSATIIGSQLKNMGLPMDDVAGQTNNLITMGADLAAQFGGSTSDAVSALSSLLRGERDPIERYGVTITEAMVKAKMAEMGLSGLSGEAERNAKLQATMALLTEQTADAQGAFAREADTAAGAAARQNAAWGNVKATLGEALLPVMTGFSQLMSGTIMPVLQTVAEWISAHPALLYVLVGALGALTVGLGIAAARQLIMNTAMLTSPTTWIIVGIVALIAALALLIANWDTVVAWLQGVWAGVVQWVKDLFTSIGDWFSSQGERISGFLTGLWDSIKATAESVWGAIVSFFQGIPGRVSDALAPIGELWSRFTEWVSRILTAVQDGFGAVVDWVKGVPGNILGALGDVGNLLYNAGKAIIEGFGRGLRAAWDGVTGWISGIGSWIAEHKGPRAYDLALLRPAGNWIMQGLQDGLIDGIPGLRATLGAVSATVAATPFAQYRAAPVMAGQADSPADLRAALDGMSIELTGANALSDTVAARLTLSRSRMAGVR